MKNFLFICLSFLLSSNLFAASYSDVSTVKGMSVGYGYARVQLSLMQEAEGCSVSKFYWLDTSQGKEMFSTLLAAKASGQNVSLQLIGCNADDLPVITHVYLCDSAFCS